MTCGAKAVSCTYSRGVFILLPSLAKHLLNQRIRNSKPCRAKSVEHIANFGNQADLLGAKQDGQGAGDRHLKLACNSSRLLIIQYQPRRCMFQRQRNRFRFAGAQGDLQSADEGLILHRCDLGPCRRCRATFPRDRIRHCDRRVELSEKIKLPGPVQSDETAAVGDSQAIRHGRGRSLFRRLLDRTPARPAFPRSP